MRTANQILNDIPKIVALNVNAGLATHKLALECLEHAAEHGDATLIDRLIKELEAGAPAARTATLREWVTMFSPIRWGGKDDAVGLLKKDSPKYVEFNIEGADVTPYYAIGKETRPTVITLESIRKNLIGMLKRVERAENGEGKAVIGEGEDVEAIKSLARSAGLLANGAVAAEAAA